MEQTRRAPSWQLEGNLATLRALRLHAVCNLQESTHGFDSLEPRAGRLWQIGSPLDRKHPRPLVEAYVREDDLIASYGASTYFPFATQVYWRLMVNNDDALRVACIVSVQTDLLDTHPVMEASCELSADEVLLLPTDELSAEPVPTTLPSLLPRGAGAHLVLLRLAGDRFTYAEAVDPSDFCGVEFSQSDNGGVRITWRLFSHFLEKGVIRRGRLCSMLVPREHDAQHAVHSFREFLASELPLTA
jgi:hypothetical protein